MDASVHRTVEGSLTAGRHLGSMFGVVNRPACLPAITFAELQLLNVSTADEHKCENDFVYAPELRLSAMSEYS